MEPAFLLLIQVTFRYSSYSDTVTGRHVTLQQVGPKLLCPYEKWLSGILIRGASKEKGMSWGKQQTNLFGFNLLGKRNAEDRWSQEVVQNPSKQPSSHTRQADLPRDPTGSRLSSRSSSGEGTGITVQSNHLMRFLQFYHSSIHGRAMPAVLFASLAR